MRFSALRPKAIPSVCAVFVVTVLRPAISLRGKPSSACCRLPAMSRDSKAPSQGRSSRGISDAATSVLERTAPSTDLVQVLEREVGMAVLPVDPVDQAAAVRVDVPVDDLPNRTGFTVFLTGLSGSGKSTISNILLAQIAESGRAVTLLDGDVVRRHLSSELGFSREHRELNIRRIGFVACEITKHGGIAICAPIAPYAQTREEVRAMIERVGSFVLVHVATPLDVCEARDRKGLYAKARAGLIEQFTGISDPYEVPGEAHVTIDTTKVSAQGAAGMILDELFARGLLERRHFAIDDNGSDG